jgi:cyclopropane fatty-acyl-phospholipid synthase-like methyltransferase
VEDAFGTVRAGYDVIGPRYREWSRHSPVRLHWVGRLLDQLPPDSLVLDLGCGPGEPATRMLTEHHRVIGVDASYEQLRLAQHAAPTAAFVQADMTHLVVAPGSLDAVASFYALGHVPSDRHAPLMHAISTWLRPGGLLLTSAPLAPGDGHESDWLGVPMFFGGIGEAATRAALDNAGLHVEDWEVVPEDEGDGHIARFLWLTARKPTN